MSHSPWGGPPTWGQPAGYHPVALFQHGGPAYAPGPPPGGFPGYPQPPRRRSPIRLVLAALIGVAVVSLGALVVVGLTSTGGQVAYANDDYEVPPPDTDPPPVLVPQSEQQAGSWLNDNALYAQTMPAPVRCDSRPIPVETATDAELDAHFEGLMECLVRAWQPPVTAAGFQLVRPSVTIYGTSITTRCGDSGVNAFYCSGDQQVYYSNKLASAVTGLQGKKWAADVVMAHEFGHLLQGRTGIFIAGHLQNQNAPDKAEGLKYLRRMETQSDCFSATFLRSVSVSLGIRQDDVQGILDSYAAVGDDVLSGDPDNLGDHGLARSRVYWGTAGLGSGQLGACNTFRADDKLIR